MEPRLLHHMHRLPYLDCAHYQGYLTQIQSPKVPAESTTQVLSLKPDSASGSTKPKRKFKVMRESNTEV
jgi:hypothetical protein